MWGIVAAAVYAALQKFLPSILAAFGIYFIADTVSEQIFTAIQTKISDASGSLSAAALNAVQFSGMLEGITLIITAYTVALSIKAAKSGLSGLGGGAA